MHQCCRSPLSYEVTILSNLVGLPLSGCPLQAETVAQPDAPACIAVRATAQGLDTLQSTQPGAFYFKEAHSLMPMRGMVAKHDVALEVQAAGQPVLHHQCMGCMPSQLALGWQLSQLPVALPTKTHQAK